MTKDASQSPPLRVSAVGYLNARPLVWDLEHDAAYEVESTSPAEAADRLLSGRADLALVPAVVLASNDEFVHLPGLGIAAEGPVESVFLYLRAPKAKAVDKFRLALDPKSRSSQMLARILLEDFRGIAASDLDCFECDPGQAFEDVEKADAVLVIGDAALGRRTPDGWQRLDLAEEWTKETNLPFVFGVWGLKRSLLARHPGLALRFQEALDRGLTELERVVGEFPDQLMVSNSDALDYLRQRIRYRLGDREELGLARFLELAKPRLKGRV